MQTLERPPSPPGEQEPKRRALGLGATVLGALVVLPIVVLLIASKVGVALVVVFALLAVLGMWVWRRGFLFIEMVAFLIHFDGLGAGPIRIGRIMAGLAAVVLLYKLVVERWRPPAIPTRHWLPVMLLILWAVISAAWSEHTGQWFMAAGLLGLAVAYYAVTALLVDSHEKVMKYLRAFWVGGLFGSASGVLALFLGTRSMGLMGDPNFFGLVEAAMIALTVYYRRNAPTQRQKHLYSLVVLFVFAGAAGAGSRSGLIGASVVIVLTMVTRPGISGAKRMRVGALSLVVAMLAFGVGFVANPANLVRGFGDRGAGRLDMWAATIPLIQSRPLTGQGFGQLGSEILPALTTTPGVQELIDTREDVSAHNTFMDIMGDLGLVGLILWVWILVVTILGFVRPRWRQTRQISTTMLVMFAPVMTSSMFLPLMNNKLAWSMFGIASALQVPSWGARWRGFVSPDQPALPPARGEHAPGPAGAAAPAWMSPVAAGTVAATASVDTPSADTGASWPGVAASSHTAPGADGEAPDWEPVTLARWDVRVSRRFRYLVAAGAMIGLVVFVVGVSAFPARWTTSGDVLLIDLDSTQEVNKIVVDGTYSQVLDSLGTSGQYAQVLQQMSGVDMTVPEIRDRVTVERKQFGAYMRISFEDTDRSVVEQVMPHLVPALDEVVQRSRQASLDTLADELRPVFPGQQRFDTGPLYLKVPEALQVEEDPPRRAWAGLVGAAVGALVALTYVLLQQRRPRVNNDDDLRSAIGLGVWTHVGRAGRRYAATADQYAQVATVSTELLAEDQDLRRVVISTPKPDRAARSLALGVAAALAAEDRRVVLVDAQVDSPLLSLRLARPRRRGLLQALDGAPLEPLLLRVNRWRLPSSVRSTLGANGRRLRFLPLGTRRRGGIPVIRPDVLDRFGPDVTLVVLAPSLTSGVPVGALLSWADATVLALVEGRTVTFDAEDAAAPIRSFVVGPSGVVMMDV